MASGRVTLALTASVLFLVIVSLAYMFFERSHKTSLEQVPPGIYLEEAIRLGERNGLGQSTAVSPALGAKLVVGEYTQLRLQHEVGRSGVGQGGFVRFSMRHVYHWSLPQITDPEKEGYVTVDGPAGVGLELVPWSSRADMWDLFLSAFPWQHAIEVRVVSGSLKRGDKITLTMGDRSGGGPGFRVQPTSQKLYKVKTFVATGPKALPLPTSTDLFYEIVGSEIAKISIVASKTSVNERNLVDVTLRAEDQFGNLAPDYSGTVKISDSMGNIITTVVMSKSDGGLVNLRLETPRDLLRNADFLRLTASDGDLNALSNPVALNSSAAGATVLWGDLHGHTNLSDGHDTVENFYKYCRDVAALDFCAVTDHGHMVTPRAWEHSKMVTEQFNEPGNFVTIQAYEWSGESHVGGDHNVFYRGSDPPIFRSKSYHHPHNTQAYHGEDFSPNLVEDLFDRLVDDFNEGDVLTIPHFGGRAANPASHNERVQRLIEVFSDHQRSNEWAYDFLRRGYKLGIMASSDNHTGRPGYGFLHNPLTAAEGHTVEIGTALIAVSTERFDRDSIFDALYERNVYATSGDRILLSFTCLDHPMGSEIVSEVPVDCQVLAEGTDVIDRLEIFEKGFLVDTIEIGSTSIDKAWIASNFIADETSVAHWVRVVQSNNEEAVSSPIWISSTD